MNTVRPFLRQSAATPNLPALIDEETTITYAELQSYTAAVAYWLRQAGIGRGDRVGLIRSNALQQVILTIACARFGAAAAPLPFGLGSDAEAVAAQRAGITASVLCDGDDVAGPGFGAIDPSRRLLFRKIYKPAPVGTPYERAAGDVDDVLWRIGFSSGTTGIPKAIGWTHRASMINSVQQQTMYPAAPGERMLMGMGVALLFAVNYWMRMLHGGGCVIMTADLSPANLIELAHRHRPTQLVTSGHIAATLANHAGKNVPGTHRVMPDSLRIICAGGGVMAAQTQQVLRDRFAPQLYNHYGSTEGGLVARTDPEMQVKAPQLAGRLLQWVDADVVDEQDNPLPPGTTGRLRFRNPAMADGYLGDDEGSGRHFRDGWFYPGDLGSISLQGYLQLAGREDDRLNLGGNKVNPMLVENVLNEHPNVLESAVVVGRYKGEQELLTALIVTRDGGPVKDIQAELAKACEEKLGIQNTPLAYVQAAQLPRNGNGKIVRSHLDLVQQRSAPSPLH